MDRTRVPRVLLITDAGHRDGLVEAVLDAVGDVPRTGLHVQLREKTLSGRALVAAGRRLRERLDDLDVPLIVNGRVDVAMAIGACGVHLPEHGLGCSDVRVLFPDAIVSRACHDDRGLLRAAEERADYALLSPVFDVPTKNAPLGLAGLRANIATASLPVVALGGITFDTAPSAISNGAHGIAVIRAVLDAKPSRADALTRLLDTVYATLR